MRRESPLFGPPLDPQVLAPLGAYLAELDRWRRTTNLTGALSATDLSRHALECLVGSQLIVHGARVVDIGSGAGLPGVPISIFRPDISMTLVEPRGKRAAFLRHVIRHLPMPSASVVEARIEEVGGQTFDAATTRAVGDLSRWLGLTPFLKPGGLLLSWTTKPEMLPGFYLEEAFPMPGSARRQVAVFRKNPS